MEEECCSSLVRGYQMMPVLLSYSVLWFTADNMGKERFFGEGGSALASLRVHYFLWLLMVL